MVQFFAFSVFFFFSVEWNEMGGAPVEALFPLQSGVKRCPGGEVVKSGVLWGAGVHLVHLGHRSVH